MNISLVIVSYSEAHGIQNWQKGFYAFVDLLKKDFKCWLLNRSQSLDWILCFSGLLVQGAAAQGDLRRMGEDLLLMATGLYHHPLCQEGECPLSFLNLFFFFLCDRNLDHSISRVSEQLFSLFFPQPVSLLRVKDQTFKITLTYWWYNFFMPNISL